jgi:hypothetical protein
MNMAPTRSAVWQADPLIGAFFLRSRSLLVIAIIRQNLCLGRRTTKSFISDHWSVPMPLPQLDRGLFVPDRSLVCDGLVALN